MEYYWERIVPLVGDEACREACGRLEERMRGRPGAEERFGASQRLGETESLGLAVYLEVAGSSDASSGRSALGKNEVAGDGVLYLTDSPRCARQLLRRGEPVLAVLHERNREADFSGIPYVCSQPEELEADYLERVYRRMRRLPWEILETERCLVRETTAEDVDAFYEIYRDPAVTRYTEGLYADREEEIRYTEDYIRQIYEFRGYGIWSVLEKKSGRVIGRAGLELRPGFDDPELGFVFGVPWQGMGLAFEVCGAILDYAREELGFFGVQAFVRPENLPSVRLCERLGMRRTDTVVLGGVFHDRYVWEQIGDRSPKT